MTTTTSQRHPQRLSFIIYHLSFSAALLLLLLCLPLAGANRIYSPQIKTLTSTVNGDWLNHPVMVLGSGDRLEVGFDELSHNYRRLVYRLQHCEPDWTVSEGLFESEWLEGFNDNLIDDYQNSINTIVEYTHYNFDIPNDKCRLKMSGNYRLYVIDEDTGDVVAMVEFMVTEQTMSLQMSATTNTDIDSNESHQQIAMSLGFGNTLVTQPSEQIYCCVMQNGKDSSKKDNPKPNYINSNGLEWSHNRSLIFNAGNEYHKYEILDVSHPTMGIDIIRWDGANYQAYPFVDMPRVNYLYDEDANGAFYIRNSDNRENDIISEYVWVNYRLKSPRLYDGNILIDGHWTSDENAYNYMMEYDEEKDMYVGRILQKQGYYSYQYLWQKSDGSISLLPSEGNFYQTENTYQAFIYYKGTGERSWRLVAYRSLQLR